MKPIHRSPQYLIHPQDYCEQREERMISLLDDFYWKSFFMLRMNDVEGDYVEFGCGSNVRSFRLAFKYRQLEHPRPHLFAFDSFEGLPEPCGIDRDVHQGWRKGAMAVSLQAFHEVMVEQGARPAIDYTCIAGYYDLTLRGKHPRDYGIEQVAMVMVDCDLYASAVECLSFIAPALVNGSILAFDDWFCFKGRSDRGEQKAFTEFLAAHPHLSAVEFQNFGWHGKSFIIHCSDEG